MQNMSKTSLLSFVRRQHFIQCYTVSPTHRGKGRRVKDEIPQQCQLLQQPGAQHIGQRENLLCQLLTGHKQIEALCQGDRVTSWKLRQNLSVQLRAERSTYEL